MTASAFKSGLDFRLVIARQVRPETIRAASARIQALVPGILAYLALSQAAAAERGWRHRRVMISALRTPRLARPLPILDNPSGITEVEA